MNEQPSVSVAIPVYNEEAVVPELLRRTRAVLDEIPGGRGVLVRVLKVGIDATDKEINEAKDKEAKKERRKELIDLYRNTFSNPYVAGGMRLVDDIVEPAQTRRYLAMALEALQTKRELRPAKKHGLMPL